MESGLGEGGCPLGGVCKVGGDPESTGEIVGMRLAGDQNELAPPSMEEFGQAGTDTGGGPGQNDFGTSDPHKSQ